MNEYQGYVKTEKHTVGKTITSEMGGGGLLTLISKRSSLKFDGVSQRPNRLFTTDLPGQR